MLWSFRRPLFKVVLPNHLSSKIEYSKKISYSSCEKMFLHVEISIWFFKININLIYQTRLIVETPHFRHNTCMFWVKFRVGCDVPVACWDWTLSFLKKILKIKSQRQDSLSEWHQACYLSRMYWLSAIYLVLRRLINFTWLHRKRQDFLKLLSWFWIQINKQVVSLQVWGPILASDTR